MKTNTFKYSGQCDVDDLIQVGNMGLMKGLAKYDITHFRKANFNTFAHWYVSGEIANYIKIYGFTIKIPGRIQYEKENWVSFKQFTTENQDYFLKTSIDFK